MMTESQIISEIGISILLMLTGCYFVMSVILAGDFFLKVVFRGVPLNRALKLHLIKPILFCWFVLTVIYLYSVIRICFSFFG